MKPVSEFEKPALQVEKRVSCAPGTENTRQKNKRLPDAGAPEALASCSKDTRRNSIEPCNLLHGFKTQFILRDDGFFQDSDQIEFHHAPSSNIFIKPFLQGRL